MFSDYEDALRDLAGQAISRGETLTVSEVIPRSRGLLVGFQVVDPGGHAELYYVEPAGNPATDGLERSVTALPGGDQAVAWKYPADPYLPALGSVVFPDACATLLQRVGYSPDISEIALLGYRPSRRAVIRVRSADGVLYFKVVRPSQVDTLVTRHQTIHGAGLPATKLVSWSSAGLLVFEQAQGVALSDADSLGLSPDQVVGRVLEVQTMLSGIGLMVAARSPIVESQTWYFDQAKNLFPDYQEQLESLRTRVSPLLRDSYPGETTTIHGDLHARQIFVDSAPPYRVTGIIDLDGVGQGFAVDDLATLCAHSVATGVLRRRLPSSVFWQEVGRLVNGLVSPSSAERSRFVAGVVTHLVGHALTVRASDADTAWELISSSQDFL